MLSQCPHCNKALNLTDGQEEKIRKALEGAQPGVAVKFGCPHCQGSIEFKKDENVGSKNASDLFPDLMKDTLYSEHGNEGEEEVEILYETFKREQPKPVSGNRLPSPPDPPDISWLKTGEYKDKFQSRDIPSALVLMADGESKNIISKAFQDLDYNIEVANSPAEAIEKMGFVNVAAIVLHTEFEGGSLEESEMHNYIKWLPMSKRRYIYYVLIGPQLHTFYYLEALSRSANLVINDKDIKQINGILRKGLQDYGNLFDPFLEALKVHAES